MLSSNANSATLTPLLIFFVGKIFFFWLHAETFIYIITSMVLVVCLLLPKVKNYFFCIAVHVCKPTKDILEYTVTDSVIYIYMYILI